MDSSDGQKSGKVTELLLARERIEVELEEALMQSVAVMFTDIKGSTAFFEKRGDIAGLAMVERHNRTLFPVIESQGGVVVKTIGDAIMARFPEPKTAAAAAVQMQQTLRQANAVRPVADHIHIRIGINWGRGMLKDTDVYGDVVNTAARVESLCDPDRILVSSSMQAELARDAQFKIRPFKREAVRGKADAIEVFRLLWNEQEEIEPAEAAPAQAPPVKVRSPEAGLLFHFEAALLGDRIQASLSERRPGEEAAVRESKDLNVSVAEINQLSSKIYSVLRRSTQTGNQDEALLGELREAGQELFQKLFPREFQQRLQQSEKRDLILSITDQLVHIPWELCYDGTQFLGLHFNLGRVVSTHQPVQEEKRRRLTSPLSLLVISSGTSELKGSQRESQRLADEVLEMGVQVKVDRLFSAPPPRELLDRLSHYDMVHYSGHSIYNAKEPESSGWVLGAGRLEARSVFEAAAGPMPALIFSNSCQSGQTEPWQAGDDSHRLTFSLANAFLLNGVQHFVGSFQDVSDARSVDMAVDFYRHLLEGESIGSALRSSRQDLVASHGENELTWASYVLYGDPTTVYFRAQTKPTEMRSAASVQFGPAELKSAAPGSSRLWAIVGGLVVLVAVLSLVLLKPWAPRPDPIAPLVSLVDQGNWAQAQGQAQTLLSSRQKKKALFILAASYLDSGDVQGAEPFLQQLSGLDSADPGLQILTAEQALSQGQLDEARASLSAALKNSELWSWQKARGQNLLGRLAEAAGDLSGAGNYFQQALASDSTYYPALVNLALLKEGQGDFSGAQALFARARQVRAQDPAVSVLGQDNESQLKFHQDPATQARVQALVKDLSQLAKTQPEATTDLWTSRPLTVSVMAIRSGGGILAQSGQAKYLELKLHEFFEQTSLPVVERRALEELLEEMKLSRSQLADQETAVRLGRLLAARYLVTGDITFIGTRAEAALRVVEIETGLVADSFSEDFEAKQTDLGKVKEFVNKIANRIQQQYPVRGRIESVQGDEVVLNIGRKVGLREGAALNVYREDEVQSLTKSGRVVAYLEPAAPRAVLEVTQVDTDLAKAKIAVKGPGVAKGMLVSLKLPNR